MFLILPVGVDYQTRRYPVVTFTLIGINAAVYLISLLCRIVGGVEVTRWIFENLWLTPARSPISAYVTTWFVHGGLFHLLGNMAYLFLFGACVEDTIGRAKFVAFYFLGGLAADFLHVLFTPGGFSSELPLGGASGAVSACIGGFLLLMAKTRIELKWIVYLMFRIWSGEWFVPAWIIISFWFLNDLLGMIVDLTAAGPGSGTAFAAHVGGTLAGLAMIAVHKAMERRRAGEAEKLERVLKSRKPSVPEQPSVPPDRASVFLGVNGEQSGPFSRTEVAGMLAAGQIGDDAIYWEDGMSEWRSVRELSG